MPEYLLYKVERFRLESGDHINNQVKYFCERIDQDPLLPQHPHIDDNPHRLFGQIAGFYRPGDIISTIEKAQISGSERETELTEPLTHDELRLLAVQIMQVQRMK